MSDLLCAYTHMYTRMGAQRQSDIVTALTTYSGTFQIHCLSGCFFSMLTIHCSPKEYSLGTVSLTVACLIESVRRSATSSHRMPLPGLSCLSSSWHCPLLAYSIGSLKFSIHRQNVAKIKQALVGHRQRLVSPQSFWAPHSVFA